MKYSTFFPKTNKREFKDDLSVNAVLLVKAGYIDQLMAGSYTLLPLGYRVVEKIKQIIREELNETGAQEMLMPLLHPREIWDQTGRWASPEASIIPIHSSTSPASSASRVRSSIKPDTRVPF